MVKKFYLLLKVLPQWHSSTVTFCHTPHVVVCPVSHYDNEVENYEDIYFQDLMIAYEILQIAYPQK